MANSTKKATLSKGDRLNWEPIATAKPVRITNDMLVGRCLTTEELKKNANFNTKFRIP